MAMQIFELSALYACCAVFISKISVTVFRNKPKPWSCVYCMSFWCCVAQLAIHHSPLTVAVSWCIALIILNFAAEE